MTPHDDALRALAGFVVGDAPLDELMHRIASTAKDVIGPVVEASVTFTRGDDSGWTAASTGPLATALDDAQYALGHGPCMDAGSGGTLLYIDDLAGDDRYRQYGPIAAEAGARSSLSVPLPVQGNILAALNLYATEPGAFSDEDVELAEAIAAQAAVAVANAVRYGSATKLAADLQESMASRAVIEQAKGIVMATQRCHADDAFAVLVRRSQHENRKLRDIAAELVAEHAAPA